MVAVLVGMNDILTLIFIFFVNFFMIFIGHIYEVMNIKRF